MKEAYKKSSGYIIGAGLSSILVEILNFNIKTLIVMLIIHPLIWTLLAFCVYKVDRKGSIYN